MDFLLSQIDQKAHMTKSKTIKINFKGGIISPGELYNILVAVSSVDIDVVSFGLRQQLLIHGENSIIGELSRKLDHLQISHDRNNDSNPNIVSSYPAEEVFISNTWLSEGVYKDILDAFEDNPQFKINISDSNQSFTPMLTGNINWVASPVSTHFWHLFIRFPKTNLVYEWRDIVYTNDVARMSKLLEALILQNSRKFTDNAEVNGDLLYDLVSGYDFNVQPSPGALKLPSFNLPYYEGLNRYNNNKFWLGIYRREEAFTVPFLKDLCQICLQSKIGQICSTPWKSIIVKGIEEKDRNLWNDLLSKYQINVRHAANELNFQVEDNCKEGLELKKYLLQYLNKHDMRTFGVCIGIKTRRKSEVFSSILIRKRPLFVFRGIGFLNFYDVLIANEFNPNERTGKVYSRYNLKWWLPEQLRRVFLTYYSHQSKAIKISSGKRIAGIKPEKEKKPVYLFQCSDCGTVYDNAVGDAVGHIPAGVSFENLPDEYCCFTCDAPKEAFNPIEREKLGLEPV